MNRCHIYGIKNCDTVRKALSWLNSYNVDYVFHDYKQDGLSSQQLKQLTNLVDWRTLLNSKSLTYRNLCRDIKAKINDQSSAEKIMLNYPLIIKRPVLVKNNQALVGFSPEKYQLFITNLK